MSWLTTETQRHSALCLCVSVVVFAGSFAFSAADAFPAFVDDTYKPEITPGDWKSRSLRIE